MARYISVKNMDFPYCVHLLQEKVNLEKPHWCALKTGGVRNVICEPGDNHHVVAGTRRHGLRFGQLANVIEALLISDNTNVNRLFIFMVLTAWSSTLICALIVSGISASAIPTITAYSLYCFGSGLLGLHIYLVVSSHVLCKPTASQCMAAPDCGSATGKGSFICNEYSSEAVQCLHRTSSPQSIPDKEADFDYQSSIITEGKNCSCR